MKYLSNDNLSSNWRVEVYKIINETSKIYELEIIFKFLLFSFLWFGCYISVNTSETLFSSIPLSVLLGIFSFIYVTLAHEGSHNPKLGFNINFLKYIADFLGASSFIWNIKHNFLHHTFTNIENIDQDLETGGVIRLKNSQQLKQHHKYQHIYAWFLYSLFLIKWTFLDDFKMFYNKKIGFKSIDIKLKDYLELIFGRFIYLSWNFLIPIYIFNHNFKFVIINFLIYNLIFGIIIATIFQLAHCTLLNDRVVLDENNLVYNTFFNHQLQTTSDFSVNSKLIFFLTGGLSFQTVHHLTPNISSIYFFKLSNQLKEFCHKNNLNYFYHKTFLDSVKSHYKFLKKMGAQ